jgi:DNA-binding MarR family transcriptional regulator
MERRRLVEREDSPEDGRGVVIRLTGGGREILIRAAPGHVAWVRSHFIALATADELDVLTALSQRVVSELMETA